MIPTSDTVNEVAPWGGSFLGEDVVHLPTELPCFKVIFCHVTSGGVLGVLARSHSAVRLPQFSLAVPALPTRSHGTRYSAELEVIVVPWQWLEPR